MTDAVKLGIGAALGCIVGVVIGSWGKAQGGACPFLCHPVGGAIFGAVIGILGVSSWTRKSGPPAALSPHYIEVESEEQFGTILAETPVVLADFYADWCGPCRTLKPTIQALATEYQGRAGVIGVNVDRLQGLASRYGVRAIPHVQVFARGEPTASLIGLEGEGKYREALDGALAGAGGDGAAGGVGAVPPVRAEGDGAAGAD